MRRLLILIFVILASCSQNPEEQIQNLEGYWSIEKVEFPNGTEKKYPYTVTLDHFALNDSIGMKNRVTPRYDNVMVTADTPIDFTWTVKTGDLILNFQDGDQAYSQKVKTCTEDQLVLVHENNTTYHYKRYQADAQQ
jgi:hypothetical protein